MTGGAAPIEAEAFSLPPLQAAIRGEAEELASGFADRAREVRLHLLEQGEHHPELWEQFSERGWSGMTVPEADGGSEGGLLGLVVVLEALAASNILLWMPVLSAAIAHAISQVGPDAARAEWLGPVASGESVLALAATEPDSGHNLFRVRTTVRRDGGSFRVSGFKAVTSGIDLADAVLVFGRAPRKSENGPARYTAVLIDPGARGATATEVPMRGREGVKQFQLELDDVEAPLDALVGAEGQGLFALWPFANVERVLTAALCVGSTRYSINRSLRRAKERSIFGDKPIGAEQAIQHPLARLHARLEAARLFVYRAAARFDAGADAFAIAGEANMAKVIASDLLYEAADHAVQTIGAEAWDERTGMLDLFLDARLAKAAPISQELALNFIGQHVLGLPVHHGIRGDHSAPQTRRSPSGDEAPEWH